MHFSRATFTGSRLVWPLVIVLLLPVADTEQVALKHFVMDEECQSEKERVELKVAESYPYNVFRIMCAFQASPNYWYSTYNRTIPCIAPVVLT